MESRTLKSAPFLAAIVTLALLAGANAQDSQELPAPPAEATESGIGMLPPPPPGPPAGPKDHMRGKFDERLRRWNEMPPEERRKLMERYDRYKQLTDEVRESIKGRHDRWEKLSDEEKERIKKRFERFHSMSEEEKQHIRGRMQQWRSMSQERRTFLREATKILKTLPPEKLEELKKHSPEDRRRRLREIFEEHGLKIERRNGNSSVERQDAPRHRREDKDGDEGDARQKPSATPQAPVADDED